MDFPLFLMERKTGRSEASDDVIVFGQTDEEDVFFGVDEFVRVIVFL